jgi:hypothetical protein
VKKESSSGEEAAVSRSSSTGPTPAQQPYEGLSLFLTLTAKDGKRLGRCRLVTVPRERADSVLSVLTKKVLSKGGQEKRDE